MFWLKYNKVVYIICIHWYVILFIAWLRDSSARLLKYQNKTNSTLSLFYNTTLIKLFNILITHKLIFLFFVVNYLALSLFMNIVKSCLVKYMTHFTIYERCTKTFFVVWPLNKNFFFHNFIAVTNKVYRFLRWQIYDPNLYVKWALLYTFVISIILFFMWIFFHFVIFNTSDSSE